MEEVCNGGWRELAVIGLLLLGWWQAGEALPGTRINTHYVGTVLVIASLLRLAALRSQSGALVSFTLALDAYALAIYCGEHRRQQRWSPRRDALLFAAAMPLERELQSRLGSDLLAAPLPGTHS